MLLIPSAFTSGSAVPAELYTHPVNHLWPTSTGCLFTRLLLNSHTRIEFFKKTSPIILIPLLPSFPHLCKMEPSSIQSLGTKTEETLDQILLLIPTKIHQQLCVLLSCKLYHVTSFPMMPTRPFSLFCLSTTASYLVSLFPFLPHPSLSWEFIFHRAAREFFQMLITSFHSFT